MINPGLEFKFEISETASQPKTFQVLWKVPKQLSYFEGHFPGFPVVPGVAVIDATLEALRQCLSKKIELLKLENAKFKKPLSPNDNVEITLIDLSPELDRWSATWKLEGESVSVAELSLQLRR